MANEAVADLCEGTLASFLGLALHVAKCLSFDRKNPQQLFAVCLFCRLTELAAGCKALLERKALVGIPFLCRGMLEAGFDIANVMKEPLYYKRMQAKSLAEKVRILENDSENAFLTPLREDERFGKLKAATKVQSTIFKGEGINTLRVKDKAEAAGALDVYKSVYSMICNDVHNDITSLEEWHLEVIDPDTYHVVLFKVNKPDMIHYLSTIPRVLLFKAKALTDFLGLKGIHFAPYFDELELMQTAVNAIEACDEGQQKFGEE